MTYFTKAVQGIPTTRSTRSTCSARRKKPSREHIERRSELEKKDQLDAALAEYQTCAGARWAPNRTRRRQGGGARADDPRSHRSDAAEAADRSSCAAGAAASTRRRCSTRRRASRCASASEQRRACSDILNFIGAAAGINVTYDQQYVDKPYTRQSRRRDRSRRRCSRCCRRTATTTRSRTRGRSSSSPISPPSTQQYDELVVEVFYISHADATELAQIVNTIMRIPQMPVQPMVMPNKTANTITVRATAPVVDVIERIIRANDKPRAEVVLDVEILEVEPRARQALRHQPEPTTAWACCSRRSSRRRTRAGGAVRAAAVQPEHDLARASAPPTSISACRRRW